MKIGKIVSILSLVFVMSIILASFGIALAGGVRGAGLLGACFFLTFGIIIVLAQVIPAGILFSSLVGAIASPSGKNEVSVQVM
ncbi:MAG: hypothetical protein ACUVWO_14410 [Thermodesulfobacteriota bacterium]